MIQIPTWLREVNQKSCLRAKDVRMLFGLGSAGAFERAVNRGDIPPADRIVKGYNGVKVRVWLVSTVVRAINKRNKDET